MLLNSKLNSWTSYISTKIRREKDTGLYNVRSKNRDEKSKQAFTSTRQLNLHQKTFILKPTALAFLENLMR